MKSFKPIMRVRDYFKIELESGKKPSVLDYLALIMIIPYALLILSVVAVCTAYIRFVYWAKGKNAYGRS